MGTDGIPGNTGGCCQSTAVAGIAGDWPPAVGHRLSAVTSAAGPVTEPTGSDRRWRRKPAERDDGSVFPVVLPRKAVGVLAGDDGYGPLLTESAIVVLFASVQMSVFTLTLILHHPVARFPSGTRLFAGRHLNIRSTSDILFVQRLARHAFASPGRPALLGSVSSCPAQRPRQSFSFFLHK